MLSGLLVLSTSQVLAQQTFGSGADMGKVINIAELMAKPIAYLNEPVTVKGKIVKVCQNKGCWADLVSAGGSDKLTMKIKDGDMVVSYGCDRQDSIRQRNRIGIIS